MATTEHVTRTPPVEGDGAPKIDMKVIRQITGGKAAVVHYITAEIAKAETMRDEAKTVSVQRQAKAILHGLELALAIVQDTVDL